jgi:hypothetical protein
VQYNNQNNKIYAQTSLEVHSEGAGKPSPFLCHGFGGGGGGPIRGWRIIFARKGVKLVSEYIKSTCYKKLWNSLMWPSSVVRNESSSKTQFLPKSQDNSGVAAKECFSLSQHQGLAFGESRPQSPRL